MRYAPSEKTCTRCKETKPIDSFKQRFVRRSETRKRRGWSSRCRQCLHILDKQREKGKRADRVQFHKALRESVIARFKIEQLEDRLERAAAGLEKRKRLCKFCGDLFTVGKKGNGHRPRLCPKCLPFRGISSTSKFSRIVRQIILDEDMQALSRLLKLFRNRTTKKYTANGTLSISVHWFLRQLLKQNFRCGVCKNKFPGERLPCIDHDHITNRVRGLLCNKCNAALGLFDDSKNRLKAAIDYFTQLHA